MDADSVQALSDAQVPKYCKATGRGFAGCLEQPVRGPGGCVPPGKLERLAWLRDKRAEAPLGENNSSLYLARAGSVPGSFSHTREPAEFE